MALLSLYTWCLGVIIVYGWDPDAGIIKSYTKMNNVTVTATSGTHPELVIDSDDNVNWVSGYCLPGGYFNRDDINVLKGACANGSCSSGGAAKGDIISATDGNAYTVAHVNKNGVQAAFTLAVPVPQRLQVISVNGIFHGITTLSAYDEQMNEHVLHTFTPVDNYKVKNILDANFTVIKLGMYSASDFSLKEIAALGNEGCTEQVMVDLGEDRRVGTIRTRHWAGNNAASRLVLRTSVDGQTWKDVAELDPGALRPITTNIIPENVRFIALKYTVNLVNYKHIYSYEIDAWDEHGVYGAPVTPIPQSKSFKELLGVNGIWGWGTKQYSDSLTSNVNGPLLYGQVASHARNYHSMTWDINDPDLDPEFQEMANGHGTQAKWWLDWDKEYRAWNNANMSVDISLQFTNKTVPEHLWDTPEASAHHYGAEIAKHFGPSQGNGLVQAVEIGNEPWDYRASFYATVLRGMASGLKSIDKMLTVLPAAFQADDKEDTSNYIGTRVLPDNAVNIDVLNLHTYSFYNDNAGVRRGTYPENKMSMFNNIRPFTRWRDTNTLSKPIWVTEWGWDADGGGEDCRASECVSPKAQALYGIRGLMLLARSNVERATWYFYANTDDCNTLFCRSGLTTSVTTHFQKKAVFYAFQALLQHVGDSKFIGIVQEDDKGFVYSLGSNTKSNVNDNSSNVLQGASHLVAWLPIDIDDMSSHQVIINLPKGYTANGGLRYTGQTGTQSTRSLHSHDFTQSGHSLTLTLTTEPMVVNLVHSQDPGIIG
ncbi:hypothetical protein ACF0H5_015682 [Mactra antiquata]